ncbi:excisionase [Butyrivibrio sp. MB2005]|uniref:excisionase n=1 Tax=Butyrivibrio sp. MB2005 TaxID=1280678 RepID=UPI00041D31EE|nr:excisionase [Butyrivibrio sp. MB2005]
MDKCRISEKFLLTIKEAAAYFNVGEKRLRFLATNDEEAKGYVYMNGDRTLLIREKFEEYFINAAAENRNKDKRKESKLYAPEG